MGGGTTAKARSAGIADAEQVAAPLTDSGATPKRGDDLTREGPQPVHAFAPPTRIPPPVHPTGNREGSTHFASAYCFRASFVTRDNNVFRVSSTDTRRC
ncbi:hypothetical protein GA0115252_110329 [Streptomyces sp. DfronAA-171]|nr:hypothetical protein GA0115252_110329 [Streptomyces sp. DfronAA-171]